MRRLLIGGLVLATLASCAPSEPPPPAPPPRPAPAPAPPAPPPVAAAPRTPDQCGAADMQYLVGKLRSEIPIPTNPAMRRVACTTCPVTMDYSPGRLNIFFEAETGVIKQVRCG